ncbi:MAG: hypothetical protein AAGF12_41785 [Myxococcota bacterium]
MSTKHALSLVHHGGGQTQDLVELARRVRDGVQEAFAIRLEVEPVQLGLTI